MKAVIIYDDFDSAARANAMLVSATIRADQTSQWNVRPWRADLLTRSGTAEEALRDATDAHLIVLVVGRQVDPLLCSLDWLENWAERRQVKDAALAVFHAGDGDPLSATVAPGLSQFAERNGLSVIFDDDVPAEDESGSFVHRSPEGVVPTVTRPPPGEGAPQDQYHSQGINE